MSYDMYYDQLTGQAQFFTYDGKIYTRDTEIKVSQLYIDSHSEKNKPIWPYARFLRKYTKDHVLYYEFTTCQLDLFGEWSKCIGTFAIKSSELNSAIEEIILPIEVENVEITTPEPKKDWEDNEMLWAWVIYIIVMAGGLIFKQFYIIWAIATIIFFNYRRKRL